MSGHRSRTRRLPRQIRVRLEERQLPVGRARPYDRDHRRVERRDIGKGAPRQAASATQGEFSKIPPSARTNSSRSIALTVLRGRGKGVDGIVDRRGPCFNARDGGIFKLPEPGKDRSRGALDD